MSALANGTTLISIKAERTLPRADPLHPSFLTAATTNLAIELESTTDLTFFYEMMQSPVNRPRLEASITCVMLPAFHWFQGVTPQRPQNPYLAMATRLPNLKTLSLTLHTTSITRPRHSEREILRLEDAAEQLQDQGQYQQAQEYRMEAKSRRVEPLASVIQRYGMDAIFRCRTLEVLELRCIDCVLTWGWCDVHNVNPLSAFNQMPQYFRNGYHSANARHLTVNPVILHGENLA